MSDSDYITPSEIHRGMRVEIQRRPWRGVVTALGDTGAFYAREDGVAERSRSGTWWSADSIGSIRLLGPTPLTRGETAVGHYQDEMNGGGTPAEAYQSTVSFLIVTYPDAEDLAAAVRSLQAYAESRTP